MTRRTPYLVQSGAASRLASSYAYQKADVVLTETTKLDSAIPAAGRSWATSATYVHHSTLALFTLMWGGNFVLAEIALRDLSPISFSVARFLVAGVAMLGILYWQGKSRARKSGMQFRLFPKVAAPDRLRLGVVAVLGATLAPWLGIEGLHLTSSGRASLWLALCPVLSAGMGYFMRTEALRKVGLIGLLIAGAGTIGLAADGLHPGRGYWLGDLLLFLSICCTAAELHLIKPLVLKYSPASMVAARTVLGGLCYVGIASASLSNQPWLNLDTWTWVAILVGGAIGVGVGQWVKVRALEALGPTRVVLYGNLVAPATLLLAWIVLGTEPSVIETMAGLLIIVGAMFLQVGDPHRPGDGSDSMN